jgi:hypothetical protein
VTGAFVEENQRELAAELGRIRRVLDGESGGERGHPAALESLCAAFGLSAFERDILLLCAGTELDSELAARVRPTFGVALGALPGAHWSALAPAGPLRFWRLVELEAGDTLVTSPLRIDERVLHHLTGVGYLDERLRGVVEPVGPEPLPPSLKAVAERAATVVARGGGPQVLLQLCGPDASARRRVAAAVCSALGLQLHLLRAADVPSAAADRDVLRRLWEREAILSGSALVLECEPGDEAAGTAAAFADAADVLVLLSGRDPLRLRRRSALRIDVPRPTSAEQRTLWEEALGADAARLDGSLDGLILQFELGLDGIASVAAHTAGDLDPDRLWEACRAQARPQLDDLAQRIEPAAGWADLVLPEADLQVLREIAAHVRQRARVHGSWGFAGATSRGLGVSALFEGPSGTGKTMAAEVLARDLALDLYRIDLSQVVSKYIGETEKNLRRVFDAAEAGGAILLFDEADALFGRRSEVKDSHDRYANIEVSYLLQRMESYRGLAVLTTNATNALDPAFMRRIRFVVRFAFPDAEQRAEIWRRIFPAATPTEGLDAEKLGRLNVAGGNIWSMALNAAFLAADADEHVGMTHLRRAAERECAKLEKPLTVAETGEWT